MGCGSETDLDDTVDTDEETVASAQQEVSGASTFKHQTFGGNGRTCATCHGRESGSVSPADAQARWAADENDPLFRAIDSDDGAGNGWTRMLGWATIWASIPLPAGVTLASDAAATSVVFERGVPTTWNTPALDRWLLTDGRSDDLEAQARSAVHAHMQPGWEPTAGQISNIAEFEQTLFSRQRLRRYANGGPAPELPKAKTKAEKRGKKFFEPAPWNPPSLAGFCAQCHSGPMLNEANAWNQVGLEAGARFASALGV